MNEQTDKKYQALREDTRPEESQGGKSDVGRPGATLAQAGLEEAASAEEAPSVLLDVPNLKVDEISLEVDELDANISLNAELANLLKLNVGVNSKLGRVKLDMKGVEAQVMMTVRLRTVADILDRVLTTIDNNPDVLKNLLQPVGETAGEVGKQVGQAADQAGQQAGQAAGQAGQQAEQSGQQAQQTASGGQNGRQRQGGNGHQRQTSGEGPQQQGRDGGGRNGGGRGARHVIEEVAGEGCTIRRSIDSFGDILEQVLDTDGKVVEEVIVGSVSDLCIVKERTKDGETVRRVRDSRTSIPDH